MVDLSHGVLHGVISHVDTREQRLTGYLAREQERAHEEHLHFLVGPRCPGNIPAPPVGACGPDRPWEPGCARVLNEAPDTRI